MTSAYLPIRTTAENYGPFPHLDYEYEPGVTAVIGPNGVGKSFLVNACAFALFGHTPRGTTLAEWALRNTDGADRVSVTHEFLAGNERYRVRRSFSSRAGGKQTLDLEYNFTGDGHEPWTPHTRESIRETQAWIAGLLGMTEQAFLASALQAQNEAPFASKQVSRTDKHDMLVTSLGLQYGPYEELARRDRKQAERQAGVLEVKLVAAEQELVAGADVPLNLIEAESVERKASDRLATLEWDLEALVQQQRQAEQRTSERRAAEAELREAETARLRLREQAAAADIARDSIQVTEEALAGLATPKWLHQLEGIHADALAVAHRIASERDSLKTQIVALGDDACPTCHRVFDNHEELVETRERLIRELAELPAPVSPDDTDLRRARAQVTERARLEERIAAWQQTIDNCPSDADMGLAEDAVTRARWNIDGFPLLAQAEVDRIQQATLEARARVNEQRRRLDEARQEKARLEAQLERLQQVEFQLKDALLQRQQALIAADLAARMEAMYGRDGIPALVIEGVAAPFLEQEATRILHRLGKPWTVEIHLGRETKKGEVRPALDILAVTETGATQRYEACSGGEQMRLDIALHVAFVRLWKQRNGSWSELYALDEPEGLDADGMAALVDVLDFLAEEFETVMLITHHSELRDSIGQTIEVSRNGNGSVVGAAT